MKSIRYYSLLPLLCFWVASSAAAAPQNFAAKDGCRDGWFLQIYRGLDGRDRRFCKPSKQVTKKQKSKKSKNKLRIRFKLAKQSFFRRQRNGRGLDYGNQGRQFDDFANDHGEYETDSYDHAGGYGDDYEDEHGDPYGDGYGDHYDDEYGDGYDPDYGDDWGHDCNEHDPGDHGPGNNGPGDQPQPEEKQPPEGEQSPSEPKPQPPTQPAPQPEPQPEQKPKPSPAPEPALEPNKPSQQGEPGNEQGQTGEARPEDKPRRVVAKPRNRQSKARKPRARQPRQSKQPAPNTQPAPSDSSQSDSRQTRSRKHQERIEPAKKQKEKKPKAATGSGISLVKFRDSSGRNWKFSHYQNASAANNSVLLVLHANEKTAIGVAKSAVQSGLVKSFYNIHCNNQRKCGSPKIDPNRHFRDRGYSDKIFSFFNEVDHVITLHNNFNGGQLAVPKGKKRSIYGQTFHFGGDADDFVVIIGQSGTPSGLNKDFLCFMKEKRVNVLYETYKSDHDGSMSFASIEMRKKFYVNIETEDHKSGRNTSKRQLTILKHVTKFIAGQRAKSCNI